MKYALLPFFLLLFFASCQKDEPLEEELPTSNGTVMDSTINDSTKMTRLADFEDRVHPTSGEARILKINDSYFLELKDFKTDSGPALKVYLSQEENPKNFIDLGDLKATSGTFNYEIPANVNVDEYPLTLIWCERFSVLFGSANFQP